jgi:hypothetical protein
VCNEEPWKVNSKGSRFVRYRPVAGIAEIEEMPVRRHPCFLARHGFV